MLSSFVLQTEWSNIVYHFSYKIETLLILQQEKYSLFHHIIVFVSLYASVILCLFVMQQYVFELVYFKILCTFIVASVDLHIELLFTRTSPTCAQFVLVFKQVLAITARSRTTCSVFHAPPASVRFD